ncbi:MAG: sulfatase [Planctomycetota bacterium]
MPASPNILLITDDQHRFDFFQGGAVPSLRTPNLARLADEGTTLTNAYSSCPLCVPTRFTWLYGLRASQATGAWGPFDDRWPTHLRSMAHLLQHAGYHTAIIGKLHSHNGLPRLDLAGVADETRARGFDDVTEMSGKSLVKWFDCAYTRHLAQRGLLDAYRRRLEELGQSHTEPLPFDREDSMDGVIGRHLRAWLEGYADERPFFLHASFCGPHFPYDPVRPYADRYRPEDMPAPAGVDDPEDARRYRTVRARYCALIEQCDDEIGDLLDVLERRGLAEDTVVIFGTDHGDMMGARGRLGKHQPYDASARTPVLVRYPGRVPGGVRLDAPAESIDLPCAILEAAGVAGAPYELLPGSPGRSWWGYVAGRVDDHRSWAYSEMGDWKMVCDRDWKFIHRRDGDDELYDRRNDPQELDDLAGDPDRQEHVRRMQRRVIESLSENIAPPTRDLAGTPPNTET